MSPVDLAQRDGGFAAAVITPLVERHVGDAAFYWTQHDRSVHSPLVDLAELRRFDRLLDAHLDGAQVAGETGWQLALAALARWRGSGEAFVCTVLALGAREPGLRLAATWAIVEQAPERMLRSVIGGLLWVEPHLAAPWVAHWTLPHTPVALQIAAFVGVGESEATRVAPPRSHCRAGLARAPIRAHLQSPYGLLATYWRTTTLGSRITSTVVAFPGKRSPHDHSRQRAYSSASGLRSDFTFFANVM